MEDPGLFSSREEEALPLKRGQASGAGEGMFLSRDAWPWGSALLPVAPTFGLCALMLLPPVCSWAVSGKLQNGALRRPNFAHKGDARKEILIAGSNL